MVNPFNGEGIAYALESSRYAAEAIVQALTRTSASSREKVLQSYPRTLRAELGGYYTLGRYFVKLIGHPELMRIGTKYGLPRTTLMRFTLKLLANLSDPRGGDAMDRVISAMCKIAPSA
jgi:flavin-dependent dehydrogenase